MGAEQGAVKGDLDGVAHEPDPGQLLHGRSHEGVSRGSGAAHRDRVSRSGRHRGPFRRGSQFRSSKFVRALRSGGLIGSMDRTGACADNAAMESLFTLLQNNVLDRQRWQTREELRLAIILWIERTYHRRRRQRALGKLTPIRVRSSARGCLCGLESINLTSQLKWGQSPGPGCRDGRLLL